MQSQHESDGQVNLLELLGNGDGLNVAMVSSMESLHEQIQEDRKLMVQIVAGLQRLADDAAADRKLVAETLTALTAAVRPPADPVVNVHVPAPEVTVNVPEANVEVTVPTPQVNVTVPATNTRREVVFERDPLTGSIAKADVREVTDGG